MIERFVGAGATVILASVREDDDSAPFFRALGEIVGRAQDSIVERRHHLRAQAESPCRQIAARREVLHLFDLAVKIVDGGDIFLTQAVEETNSCRSTQRE